MVSKIKSAVINGLQVVPTEVEVGFSQGLPGMVIVGLPDNAVKESKERIRFAIKNSGLEYPGASKTVINLSPADTKKEGSGLDLPMALGMIMQKYGIDFNNHVFSDFLFCGELALDGKIRPVKGILNIALSARNLDIKGIVIPPGNGCEAAFVDGIKVYAPDNLSQAIEWLMHPEQAVTQLQSADESLDPAAENDFSEIKGQHIGKRVMEIGAAGFHNILMMGPPGSGKSMLSKTLPSILPAMTDAEVLETSLIYSAAGLLCGKQGLIKQRPFRSPHHTISDVGISGGGSLPAPGEISLAHNGVLFLDELPYFKKSALEVLRQPLEDGNITISRSMMSLTFPARFMLVAAMNPCEDSIGFQDNQYIECTAAQKRRYYGKISRPLLDRIDLQISLKKVPFGDITSNVRAVSSKVIRGRVAAARQIQLQRFAGRKKKLFANGQMGNREIKKYCTICDQGQKLLETAMGTLQLSARGYYKTLKVARTIADLEGADRIVPAHLQEALQYRSSSLHHFIQPAG